MTLIEGTRVYALYGRRATREPYQCHYSLNPVYRERMLTHGLVVSGVDGDGEIRVIERTDHPFFLATLFVPLPISPNTEHVIGVMTKSPPSGFTSAVAASRRPTQ